MPFWSSKGNEDSAPAATDFSDGSGFDDGVPLSASGPSGGASGAGGGGMAELQQFAAAIQQQAIIQQTITTLSDKAFESCITKPSDSMSGREAACIQAVTMKWLDANQFMVKRLEKKMAAGQKETTF